MFVQTERPMALKTPLGPDVLLLAGLRGHEGISELFHFQLDLASHQSTIAFDKVLGQKVSVEWSLPDGGKRYFSGIVNRISQGERSMRMTRFSMQIVPQLWLLTRRLTSRIFQHKSVPDILREVLTGIDIAFEQVGTFQPRDYCVQYRETDFQFASRLMEEEGLYYFFKHTDSSHTMVVANTPQSHSDLPSNATVIYEETAGGVRDENRIWQWEKIQELRSGKSTLWDHCFELPGKHLEADKATLDSVQIGRNTYKLQVGGNDSLELYDYPGGFAGRFDGINSGGGEQPSEIQKIFEDNKRTVEIRMQAETARALVIRGGGDCQEFVTGYKFTLTRHFSDDGKYVITSVDHVATQPLGADRGKTAPFHYENHFTCIPLAIPYRPARVTPVPTVRGTQTATVVGPSGQEIYTDKYGRVKVQFHWDREGQNDADSSCWVRVASYWAGKQWGAIHIPRIGQEVVVDFLEGNPDEPIVVGSVYNADQMPPYKLPDHKTKSGIRSRSSLGGAKSNANEIRFEDDKDNEQIFINAEKDLDQRVENDCREFIGNDRHMIVGHDQKETVKRDKHLQVAGNRLETITKDASLTIGGKRLEEVTGEYSLKVSDAMKQKVGMDLSINAGMNFQCKAGMKYAMEAGTEIHLKAGATFVIEAGAQLSLKAAGSFVDIGPAGVTIQGPLVNINSGGAAGSGSGSSPADPSGPKSPGDPAEADDGTKNVD